MENNNFDKNGTPVEEMHIKLLNPAAKVPKYAYDGESIACDLVATSYKYDEEIDCHVYETGIAIQLNENEAGLILPCSRNRKTDYYIPNTPGLIDPGYTGPITVNYKNRLPIYYVAALATLVERSSIPGAQNAHDTIVEQFTKPPYQVGDVVAQLLIVPAIRKNMVVVDELNSSRRGSNGHGSTEKK